MITGYDHLLFLAGVIFFLHRLKDVALYVTLFALGHSTTLLLGVLADAPANPYLIDAVIGLSVVAQATSLLTIGLVRRWGELAPAWIPLIGGRRVPPGPVVVVALLGSLVLTYLWVGAARAYASGELRDGFVSAGWEALFVVAYAPLLLWGPLVAAVTFDYWRRHAARPRAVTPASSVSSV